MWEDTLENDPEAEEITANGQFPRIKKVIKEKLITKDELAGIEDLVIVGPIKDNGEVLFDAETEDTSIIPDDAIRVVRDCRMGNLWDFGSIENSRGGDHLVSYGVNVMVQATSLPILETASDGRVTPLRLWHWAMHVRKSEEHGWVLQQTVDYGGPDLDQWPKMFPGMEYIEIIKLEDKPEREIYEELVFRGRIWVWMRPDRFPLIVEEEEDLTETVTSPERRSSTDVSAAPLECLPIELLALIVKGLDVSSFLAFTQTSHHLRSSLMKLHILDALARGELWSRPGPGPASEGERDWWNAQTKKLEEQHPGQLGPGFDWRYLKRCYSNPSMMNRRRIWRCVEQIEQRVIEFEANPTIRSLSDISSDSSSISQEEEEEHGD